MATAVLLNLKRGSAPTRCAGAGTGNGAASGKYHDVGEFGLGFDFFCLEGGGQEQEEGQSARNQGVESRFHYFSL